MQVTPLYQKIKKANVPELSKQFHHVLNAQHSLIWVRDGVLVGCTHWIWASSLESPNPSQWCISWTFWKLGTQLTISIGPNDQLEGNWSRKSPSMYSVPNIDIITLNKITVLGTGWHWLFLEKETCRNFVRFWSVATFLSSKKCWKTKCSISLFRQVVANELGRVIATYDEFK